TMGFLPFFSLETWALLVMFISLFIMYGYWSYGVFEKLGIPCPKPIMYWGTVTKGHSVCPLCFQVYYIKDYIMYELRTPMLAVMDVSMLKTILVKECFSLFPNRRNLRLNGDLYDIVSLSEDDNWRRIRNILTPAFTTGRIKEMFEIMKQHSRKLTDSLRPKAHNEEVINVKDFLGAYSLDAMASCAYSIDTDTIKDPSHPFINHAKKLLRISIPLFLIQGFFPFLLPLLEISGFSLFPKSCVAYFKSVLEKVRAERRGGSHQVRENTCLSDHEIMSQAIIFVAAGFDTSGTTLAFLAYNLAKNPEVMRRLQEEIDTTFPSKVNTEYKYLCFIIRLYPPIARIERVAKATVEINGITVPKDMIVTVPVYALHRDPDLWPDPEEFKPDRFSKENKQSINPYAYLPFGIGPRNCIGMRFALVMVKLALVEVLQNYSFSICKETEIPLEMDPTGLLGPLRPIKLKLVARSIASANVDN
uniref:unspecific monooxygenase n=1 Tax=Myripristis murdjan TaxID=586833 RepID=A0A667WFX6_9TELE